MTHQEAQLLLDSMLMPFNIHKRRLQANATLSDNEKELLLQIVVDFEGLSEKYDYKKALADIAAIMRRYVKEADGSTEEGNKYVIQPDALPFLIHQVLFFVAVSCNVYDSMASQNDILSEIEKNGVSISHNFFSRKNTTPIQYISMCKYEPPKMVTNYMGQKHGELSVAIKNLVYQAGKYDIFCDIFGGSGAALLSVDRRKNTGYVYNELNRNVRNLFEVLADDSKHLELIEELETLQKDLRGDGRWLEYVDFEQEVQDFVSSMSRICLKHRKLVVEDPSDFDMEYSDVVKWMRDIRAEVLSLSNDFSFSFDGETYDKQYLLNEVFNDVVNPTYMNGYELFMSFFRNYRLIWAFWWNFISSSVSAMQGEFYSELDGKVKSEDHSVMLQRHKRYRFYMYYAYFMNLLNKSGTIEPDSMVRYAVAEIYKQFLTTHGKTGVSPILRMDVDLGCTAGSNATRSFLAQDFREKISNVHKIAWGTVCEGLDCIDMIKKYQHSSQETGAAHNNPIFYSDSPYIETSDYANKAAGVPAFDSNKMKDLIVALKASGDNFIFSCRAVKGSVNGSETTDKLKMSNMRLKAAVFDCFSQEFIQADSPLWVLAIEKRGSLANLIQANKVAEIMITNFEIADFSSNSACCKNTTFKTYTFQNFMEIWSQNANV